MRATSRVYTARYVFPVEGDPVPGGVVVVEGDRIGYCGPALDHVHGKADVDFGNAAITPGFVNAHTHLELGGLRGKLSAPPSFAEWLREVVAFRRSQADAERQDAICAGVEESLAAGVTLVGDISTRGLSWPILRSSPIAAVVYYELIGMHTDRAGSAYREARDWLQQIEPSDQYRPGLSPHAPYTVRPSLYRAVASLARRRQLPVATHWAETLEEWRFRENGSGPLRDFLIEMGAWDDFWAPERLVTAQQIVRWFAGVRMLWVHANYPEGPRDAERQRGRSDQWLSAAGNNAVAYCPRTHAYFGHDPHPFREMLQAGVRVCLGTDSLASSPSLSILEEMRFLYQNGLFSDGPTLLRMGTLNGAWALGREDGTGSLRPGKGADFAVVPLPDKDSPDAYRLLFDSDLAVQATFVAGQQVFAK